MYEELFVRIDDINKRWREVERLIAKMPFVGQCDLSVQRHGDTGNALRLFYKDRPVVDCTVNDKIEATKVLPTLIGLLDSYRQIQLEEATAALGRLDASLEHLRGRLDERHRLP